MSPRCTAALRAERSGWVHTVQTRGMGTRYHTAGVEARAGRHASPVRDSIGDLPGGWPGLLPLCGHHRATCALEAGYAKVPVIERDLPEEGQIVHSHR